MIGERHRATRAVPIAFTLLVGCPRHDEKAIAKDPTPVDAIADVAPPPKPAQVRVIATTLCMTGTCEVLLETKNDGDAPIALEDEMVVERAEDGGFVRVVEQYVTIGACDPEVSTYGPHPGRPCRTIAARSSLKADPWRGLTCSSQCVWTCRANAMHPKGSYRFVVRECGGAGRSFASDVVSWPGA